MTLQTAPPTTTDKRVRARALIEAARESITASMKRQGRELIMGRKSIVPAPTKK